MKIYRILLPFILTMGLLSCNTQTAVKSAKQEKSSIEKPEDLETAYFASGCFWCVEAIFESVKGVGEVVSGYSGGEASNATYPEVSAGRTDHAEAVEVFYDPEVVSYETLLKVFFGSHDPTTLNQQGPDKGRQYRSAIFYQNEEEKAAIDQYIAMLKEKNVFDGPITTEVVPFEAFYDAEEYHQDFERKNPNQSYIRAVSIPRLKRFQSKYPELLKENHQ
ncbi:peptide-methionine (S)-S-oxide reductase MsrA [Portibacter marinus]|uniref:peptide-methionine (S)-S-oxide reductase MsrA n=1 Tax=Portibacter marinus TaxID=2898660 RepID=UPI001F3F644B|nr:peptide-methionine (S)-S-oxide reductase MsrA [Portibacter marinus]